MALNRKRIAIIGATGSGKTTLACRLSERLNIPLIDLDVLFWNPGWKAVPLEVFRQQVGAALPPGPEGAWIVAGNYHQVRDLVWNRADTIVWLDYPLIIPLFRLLGRTISRIIDHKELYNGNYETFHNAFLSRDSIILYLFQSFKHHRQTYPTLLAQPEYSHLVEARLKSPREATRWVKEMEI